MASTFVVPRRQAWGVRVAHLVTRAVRWTVVILAAPLRDFSKKDALLAIIGPTALLAQLVVFLALFVLGFSLALWPYTHSISGALALSSSQIFSAGLARPRGSGSTALEVLGAVTGAIAIALQIGYLPAIYQSFNRREALVAQMESRAGLPAWGPELLMRHQLISSLDALGPFYRAFEEWSSDLAESHVSYPILIFFRSPEPGFSWVLALLAVLDAAALQLSVMPSSAPIEGRFCLRMGFTALRRIVTVLGWEYDEDPRPDADIALSYEEFSYAVSLLQNVGILLERTPEEAWPHFKGWRVNYEAIAYRLADGIVAPRAPWSGDRRHMDGRLEMPKRPPHRSPEGRVIDEMSRRPPG